MNRVKAAHPFSVLATVVLPDHLHTIGRLPPQDADYPMRWSLIKSGFSRPLEKGERIRPTRIAKRERGIWQRRYWEHQIRDADDLERPVAYIHYNPVKNGLVIRPVDWPHSTLHAYIKRGMVARDWGSDTADDVRGYGER
jgi:putative transposase